MNGNEIDRKNQRIQVGSSDSRLVIGHEQSAKADMGAHGEAYAAMVSNLAMNGEPDEDPTYGKIVGSHCRYQRGECASRFRSDKDC